jgi:hypothetical protein
MPGISFPTISSLEAVKFHNLTEKIVTAVNWLLLLNDVNALPTEICTKIPHRDSAGGTLKLS